MQIKKLGFIASVLVPALLAGAPQSAWAQDAAAASRVDALEAQVAQAQRQMAQLARPPSAIPGLEEGAPIQRVQDAAGVGVRLDRLDGQLRVLTGQIEQLQFQQKRMEEQMRKAQQDVDFRFQELGGKPGAALPKRGDSGEAPRAPAAQAALPPVAAPVITSPGPAATQTVTPGGSRRPPRGDAFDPASQPTAPGAPRPLSGALPGPAATIPGTPMDLDAEPDPLNTPVDLGQPGQPRPSAGAGIEPLNPGGAPLAPAGPTPPLAPAVTAALPPQLPKDDYQQALANLKQGQYETAEQGLRSFITKNPRSGRLPDATYYLGETYFQRGRHREAAEQFLKLSTDYSSSNRAPDGLLRLGMSLKAMGANEQACATFGEIARKYPTASITVRNGATREMQRAKCTPG